MNQVTQILERKDGTQVKLVATEMFGAGLQRSIDVFALKRNHVNEAWQSVSNRPHPDWRSMSVSDYIRHGRSELLRLVSHAEILKVTKQLA